MEEVIRAGYKIGVTYGSISALGFSFVKDSNQSATDLNCKHLTLQIVSYLIFVGALVF